MKMMRLTATRPSPTTWSVPVAWRKGRAQLTKRLRFGVLTEGASQPVTLAQRVPGLGVFIRTMGRRESNPAFDGPSPVSITDLGSPTPTSHPRLTIAPRSTPEHRATSGSGSGPFWPSAAWHAGNRSPYAGPGPQSPRKAGAASFLCMSGNVVSQERGGTSCS